MGCQWICREFCVDVDQIFWDVSGFVDSSVWMWTKLVGRQWICRQFGVDVDQIGGTSVDL